MPTRFIFVFAFFLGIGKTFAQHHQNNEESSYQLKKLQQFRWQNGFVFPQHYRNSHYEVSLNPPSHAQRWYQVRHQYILINQQNIIIQTK